jgi:hypothetical protein
MARQEGRERFTSQTPLFSNYLLSQELTGVQNQSIPGLDPQWSNDLPLGPPLKGLSSPCTITLGTKPPEHAHPIHPKPALEANKAYWV